MSRTKNAFHDEICDAPEQHEPSLMDDMADFGLLLDYAAFLNDKRNPVLSFGTWKARYANTVTTSGFGPDVSTN